MTTASIDSILNYHFNITANRLHKSKVLSIFQMYIPNMTMRKLVPILKERDISYNDSLREFGDSYNKGIFTNLEIKVAEKNDELLIPIKVKDIKLKIPTKVIGYSGKTLAQNSVDTWSYRLKKLDSLGLQSALDNNAYDVVENIVTDESDSLNTRCTSITAILNRLYNTTKDNDISELAQKLILLRKKWIKEINIQRSGNILNAKEKELWVDWEDVIAKRDAFRTHRYQTKTSSWFIHIPSSQKNNGLRGNVLC